MGGYTLSCDHTHHRPRCLSLAVKLSLNQQEIAELVLELGDELPPLDQQRDCPAASCGLCVAPLDTGILQAMTRLVALLSSPTDSRILAPLVRREIIYRALLGEMGWRLRDFAVGSTYLPGSSVIVSPRPLRAETTRTVPCSLSSHVV